MPAINFSDSIIHRKEVFIYDIAKSEIYAGNFQQSFIFQSSKNLFVSQSTLSAAVKELESDLGITIFKRTNRGVSFTYDGEDFIKYAKEIVEQSQYLEQRYHARKSLPMRFSVSCQHLPSAVRAFTSFLAEINSPTYDIAISRMRY